jgi:hypothetical protein
MQLSFIELLYISAQPLHKVNITKRNPIEGHVIGACLAWTGKSYSRRVLASVVPQELLDCEWC